MKLIELNIQQIIALCQRYKVKNLSVFGSILTDKFHDKSDVDLLVNFNADHSDYDYVENYFGLKDSLENLLGREVDLLEEKGLKNKYFIQEVNRTKQLIYG
jgi:predicted nucleotidyltransferase